MKKWMFSALICSFIPLFAWTQVTPKTAQSQFMEMGVTNAELIDQLMVVVPGVGSNARDMLMEQSVKPYMMPVRRVGAHGSLLSYALASCLEYYVNLERNYKVNLSPDYISLSLESAGQRVSLEEAYKFLVQNGTVSAAILPYDATAITSAVYATQKYKIMNYLYIFRDLTRPRQKVFETRKALMRGNPVLVELMADESLKNHQGAQVLKPRKNGDRQYPLIVVGYDENQEAFEVMSCWGSQWGASGYGWIKYDDFGDHTRNGYVMLPQAAY